MRNMLETIGEAVLVAATITYVLIFPLCLLFLWFVISDRHFDWGDWEFWLWCVPVPLLGLALAGIWIEVRRRKAAASASSRPLSGA